MTYQAAVDQLREAYLAHTKGRGAPKLLLMYVGADLFNAFRYGVEYATQLTPVSASDGSICFKSARILLNGPGSDIRIEEID